MAVTFLNRPQYMHVRTGAPAFRGVKVRPALRSNRAESQTRQRERVVVSLRWSDIEGLLFAAGIVFGLAYIVHSAISHTGPFASAPSVTRTITVRVAPGDTLWSLSGRYPNASISSDERVAIVRSLNPRLDPTRSLKPGSKVVLPVAFNR